jgi:hypothetical protein
VDAAPAILSEIMKDKGWFMGQYMQSLSSDGIDGGFGVGPLACIPLVLTELGVRDGAKGTFGAGTPTCIPNRYYLVCLADVQECHTILKICACFRVQNKNGQMFP